MSVEDTHVMNKNLSGVTSPLVALEQRAET